jgi:hypothetical protein
LHISGLKIMTAVSSFPPTATAAKLAGLFGIGERQVRRLAADGIIPRASHGLRAEFEKFPDRFPENRNALIVLDALEARARNAIADLIPGRGGRSEG